MYCYLYKITNTLDGKVYVGQSIEPHRRWVRHKAAARSLINGKKMPKCPQYVHKAMAKHGISNFTFEVVATSKSKHDAGIAEDVLIEQYDSRNEKHGYNLVPGGRVLSGKDNPFYGKHHSQKSKDMIAKKMSGNENWKTSTRMSGCKHSNETKRKISQKLKGNSNACKHKATSSCQACKTKIRNATYCKRCVPRTKIEWPSKQQLLQMIQDSNYEATARQLGVSSNAIRKRLKTH